MSIQRPNRNMHDLAVLKGAPASNRLLFTALSDENTVLSRGAVCSINSAGKLILGCPAGDGVVSLPMPMFAWDDVSDNGAIVYEGMVYAGQRTCVVGTGGFEIETTEYDPDALYTPNMPVVSQKDIDGAFTGLVTPATKSFTEEDSDTVVGIVSQGTRASKGANRLCFWTVFLPGRGAAVVDSGSSVIPGSEIGSE